MIMRKKYLFLVMGFFSLLTGCNRTNERQDFILKESIQAIVDSFTLINPDRGIYELYIDKKSFDEGVLFLYAGEEPYTEKENIEINQSPLIEVFSNGVPVRVFSGAERYINPRQTVKYAAKQVLGNKENVLWVITDSCGVLTTIKDYNTLYPFFPLPIFNGPSFNPPVIIPESELTEENKY